MVLDGLLVYVAGPLTKAAIAVGAAITLRGRGGDPVARAAASGALEPVLERAGCGTDGTPHGQLLGERRVASAMIR